MMGFLEACWAAARLEGDDFYVGGIHTLSSLSVLGSCFTVLAGFQPIDTLTIIG